VALNYNLLKWLGALTQSFQEEMDKVLARVPLTDDSATFPVQPASTLEATTTTTLSPPSSRAPSRASTPPISSRPPSPNADTKPRRMTYHKRTPGVIELPQLVQLGDITPRAQQLMMVGLRLDLIPKWVHEGAALPLEGIMKLLSQLYSRQLRQMKRTP